MANYRKLKVHEVGTDTYIDYEANYQRVPCACAFHPRHVIFRIDYVKVMLHVCKDYIIPTHDYHRFSTMDHANNIRLLQL
ncbi:unnamed protein product [Rotaria sp. Silwood2]|nr:unnamed protein product [Rotaria sp. Silwood2]